MSTLFKNVWFVGSVCVIGLFVVVGLVAMNAESEEVLASVEPVPSTSMHLPPEETEEIYMEFIDLLHQEYIVSQMNSTDASDDMVSFMTELMKANSQLGMIITTATPYMSHENQVVEVAGTAIVAGSMGVQKANTDFLAYLRGLGNGEYLDQSEMAYQFATYRSSEVESYKLMIMGVGQLNALAWHFATTDNPSGPIPYVFSKEQRERILAKIDYLFADAFVKDDLQHREAATRNAIVLAVASLRDNLIPDTYEEAAAMQN